MRRPQSSAKMRRQRGERRPPTWWRPWAVPRPPLLACSSPCGCCSSHSAPSSQVPLRPGALQRRPFCRALPGEHRGAGTPVICTPARRLAQGRREEQGSAQTRCPAGRARAWRSLIGRPMRCSVPEPRRLAQRGGPLDRAWPCPPCSSPEALPAPNPVTMSQQADIRRLVSRNRALVIVAAPGRADRPRLPRFARLIGGLKTMP